MPLESFGVCRPCTYGLPVFLTMLAYRHNWGTWVMKLNEMTDGLEKKIAPTDCRLRPDQHYMEIGEFDKV